MFLVYQSSITRKHFLSLPKYMVSVPEDKVDKLNTENSESLFLPAVEPNYPGPGTYGVRSTECYPCFVLWATPSALPTAGIKQMGIKGHPIENSENETPLFQLSLDHSDLSPVVGC